MYCQNKNLELIQKNAFQKRKKKIFCPIEHTKKQGRMKLLLILILKYFTEMNEIF